MDVSGRVALVTGAARGIGLEIARHLASCGMSVVVNDVNAGVVAVGEELAACGGRATAIVADVTRRSDVQRMFDTVEEELGPLWLLVNNAAVFTSGPTAEVPEHDWDLTMGVDSKGVFLCSQAAIQRMVPRGGGRIVNMTSIAARIVRTGQIAYCTAKAGINHFTRCLAIEVAPHGITVNAVMPGMTLTDMLRDSFVERGLDLDGSLALIPDGRFALPRDHAALIAWLASDDAAHITGQLIAVDGGQSQFMPLTAPTGKMWRTTTVLQGADQREATT
jgi:NAD(P)-dependent dehydrogenase (short-subunit alcohol dehydrogenase family)